MSDTLDNKDPLPSEVALVQKVLAAPLAKATLQQTLSESKRPALWRRRSTASYYRERFGLEFRSVIDGMLADEKKEDVMYLYSVYCTPEYGMNSSTLYTRIYHSMRYMLDHLDTPEKKYADAMSKIEVRRERNVGIRISFMRDVKLGKPFIPTAARPIEEVHLWRNELEEWIAGTHPIGERKIIDKLTLKPHEIEELRLRFANMSKYSASVTADSIKIMSMPSEDE